MARKQKLAHSNNFCQKSHPIIEKLAKEFSSAIAKDKAIKTDLLDELQLLEAEADETCDCRKAICIILQAANLNKWMRLLFTQHEGKFHKYSIRIPSQYEELKYEISEIIHKLQENMLMTINQSADPQISKKSKKKTKTKTKTIQKTKSKQVKIETYPYQGIKIETYGSQLIKFEYDRQNEGI